MSIVEFRGGPITHRYLMKRRTVNELRREIIEHREALGEPCAPHSLDEWSKDQLAGECLKLIRRRYPE